MKSVVINDKPGAVDILKDYIGHTLKDVEVFDGSHTEQMQPKQIKLTFSDEPACGILDSIEQECAYNCWVDASKNFDLDWYKPLHKTLTDRIAEVGPFE